MFLWGRGGNKGEAISGEKRGGERKRPDLFSDADDAVFTGPILPYRTGLSGENVGEKKKKGGGEEHRAPARGPR